MAELHARFLRLAAGNDGANWNYGYGVADSTYENITLCSGTAGAMCLG